MVSGGLGDYLKIKNKNMETIKEVKKITNQLAEKYKPEKIILFGSFAYGKPKKNSDIDLLVIKKTKLPFPRRLLEVAEYIDSDSGTDILVYTPREWENALKEENYFIKEINEKGKVVYAKNK